MEAAVPKGWNPNTKVHIAQQVLIYKCEQSKETLFVTKGELHSGDKVFHSVQCSVL